MTYIKYTSTYKFNVKRPTAGAVHKNASVVNSNYSPKSSNCVRNYWYLPSKRFFALLCARQKVDSNWTSALRGERTPNCSKQPLPKWPWYVGNAVNLRGALYTRPTGVRKCTSWIREDGGSRGLLSRETAPVGGIFTGSSESFGAI